MTNEKIETTRAQRKCIPPRERVRPHDVGDVMLLTSNDGTNAAEYFQNTVATK